jgi:hypothetical protein
MPKTFKGSNATRTLAVFVRSECGAQVRSVEGMALLACRFAFHSCPLWKRQSCWPASKYLRAGLAQSRAEYMIRETDAVVPVNSDIRFTKTADSDVRSTRPCLFGTVADPVVVAGIFGITPESSICSHSSGSFSNTRWRLCFATGAT